MIARLHVHLVRLALALCAAMAPMKSAHAAPEYSIKAAYLLLFTRYVEWPPSAFAASNAPIVLCILGADPFGQVLDQTIAGQQSQKRPLSLRRIGGVEQADGCHLAFIGARESSNHKRWIAELASRPVLTVAEHPTAFAHGCVVSFVAETGRREARIRFEVSVPAMQRAGLKISSPMLVAARKVHRDAGA